MKIISKHMSGFRARRSASCLLCRLLTKPLRSLRKVMDCWCSRAALGSTHSPAEVLSTPRSARKPGRQSNKVQSGESVLCIICVLPFRLAGGLKAHFPDGENVTLIFFLSNLTFWIVTVQHKGLLATILYNFDHEDGSQCHILFFFNLLPLGGRLPPHQMLAGRCC